MIANQPMNDMTHLDMCIRPGSSEFVGMFGTVLDDPCLDLPVQTLEDLLEDITRLDEPDGEEDNRTDRVELLATTGLLLQTGR